MWVEGRGHLPGQLVVVSGPSGSGKSSVLRQALLHPGVNARLSVSATTREPRPGECDGVDYYFLTQNDFREAIGRGEFLEWAEYGPNLYGTPARPVYDALAEGMTVVLEIEVLGALQIRQHAPGALFVFIRTPTFRILEERLRGRGTETEASVLRRLRKARQELAEAHWYDVQIINDEFHRCVAEFVTTLSNVGPGG
ncbi:MAG: guanylate kinase [Isosphaeraceae bacterium]